MEIKKTKEVALNKINVLVYGEVASGKTRLSATLPPEETLILNAEKGLLSLKDYDIDSLEINSFHDVRKAISFIKNNKKYKYVVIDSLTEISFMLVQDLKKEYSAKETYKMWGDYQDTLTKCIKAFRNLPQTVIFICQQNIETEENAGSFRRPDVHGALKYKIPQYFDFVFFLVSLNDGEKRVLLTRPTEKYLAKDRSGLLDRVEQPDLKIILQKTIGGI